MNLLPLGVFGMPSSTLLTRELLAPHVGALDGAVRKRAADYLAGGAIIIAWMEYSRDLLGDKFHMPGGTGTNSDGLYYWRADASEYVRNYGIALPTQALDHMENLGWIPPTLTAREEADIENWLESSRLAP